MNQNWAKTETSYLAKTETPYKDRVVEDKDRVVEENRALAKLYLEKMGLSCMVEALVKIDKDVYRTVLYGGVVYDLFIGKQPKDYNCAMDCEGTVVYQYLHMKG